MKCPFCHHPKTHVFETRPSLEGQRRQRQCLKCKGRFSTLESIRFFRQAQRERNDDLFEAWLDGLPDSINLKELRELFDKGLEFEQALKVLR